MEVLELKVLVEDVGVELDLAVEAIANALPVGGGFGHGWDASRGAAGVAGVAIKLVTCPRLERLAPLQAHWLATSDLRLAAAAREPPARRHSPTACPSVIPSTRNPRAPPTTPSSSPIAPRGLTKPGADAAGRCTPAMCPPGLHAPSSAHR